MFAKGQEDKTNPLLWAGEFWGRIMNVLIIDIDSTIPNLALKKVEKYHRDLGDNIEFTPIMRDWADKVYVSCIFPENKCDCDEWENDNKVLIGGTGYDIKIKLPIEIQKVKPKINWGFTTRGCIRKCKFCFVPEKEGITHIVGDIYDIWDGQSKELFIMDNNILSAPAHFLKIANQLRKEKIKVDFNQGLDHRLLTHDVCKELLSLRHINEIRFAFDDIGSMPTVKRALRLLINAGMGDWKTRWYVYISPDDTFETVYPRMEFLRKHKQSVYVMRDKKVYDNPLWIALASWGNTMGAFKMGALLEICKKSDRMVTYFKYIKNENFNCVDKWLMEDL